MLRRAVRAARRPLRAGRRRHLPLLRQPHAAPLRRACSACNSGFTILDRGDSEDVIGLLRARLGLDKKERRFPRKQTIGEMFSMAVNKIAPARRALVETRTRTSPSTPTICIALQAAYAPTRRERQVLDYDDLLVKLHELARASTPRRAQRLAQRYRYVMVDEYQDTNPLQAQIVRLLAARARQRHGGRRRRAEHLRLPRRRLPQHHGLPRRSSPARA